jgi:ring-opening amidohydrolase-like protein
VATDNAEPEHRLGIVLEDEPGLLFRDEPADSPHSTGGLNVMLRPIEVHKVPIESVSDASGLSELIEKGVFSADDVIAVVGKTEGNGGVNDYTRIISTHAYRDVIQAMGTRSKEQVEQIPLVWSGGTDGVISPHATIFAYAPEGAYPASDEPRVTVGSAMSDQILPEDIGRPAMVEKVAVGVRKAMEAAGITDPADVHYVQTKTPLLVQDTINDAVRRGHTVFTHNTLQSMDVSNATTALGIAVALGEIEMPTADQIFNDLSLFSSVASCSSGVELDRAQIVVVGNVRGVGGRFRIGHSVMQDALDIDGVWAAIRNAGLDDMPADTPHPRYIKGRLVNLFLKCEADPSGRVRGRRNIMLDDSDVAWHRQIKAAVGGVVAAVTGDPMNFVSVAAVHQGPSGGGPVAAIVDMGH